MTSYVPFEKPLKSNRAYFLFLQTSRHHKPDQNNTSCIAFARKSYRYVSHKIGLVDDSFELSFLHIKCYTTHNSVSYLNIGRTHGIENRTCQVKIGKVILREIGKLVECTFMSRKQFQFSIKVAIGLPKKGI